MTRIPTSVAGRVLGRFGKEERSAIQLRWVATFLVILACSGVTHWLFSPWPVYRLGGVLMLLSSATLVCTAAVAGWLYPDQRVELVGRLRQFLFGVVLFPGVGIAILMRALGRFGLDASGTRDQFISLLEYALPAVYVFTVLIPAAVFVKYAFGLGSLSRSRRDDEEQMRVFTRLDGLH